MVDALECGNEPLGSLKYGEISRLQEDLVGSGRPLLHGVCSLWYFTSSITSEEELGSEISEDCGECEGSCLHPASVLRILVTMEFAGSSEIVSTYQTMTSNPLRPMSQVKISAE